MIYGLTRASSKKQVDSPEQQREVITARCAQLGLSEILMLDEDLGTSGTKTKFADRKQGRFLLLNARRNDMIIVTKIDRLGRNTADILTTLERFDKRGVKIIVCNFLGNSELDMSTAMGRVMVMVMAMCAQIEQDFRRERLMEAIRSRQERGIRQPNHAGYGRKIVVENGLKRLEWDMQQLEYIAEIVRRNTVNKESIYLIALDFWRRGVKDHRGVRWGWPKTPNPDMKSATKHFLGARTWFLRAKHAGILPPPYDDIAANIPEHKQFHLSVQPTGPRKKKKKTPQHDWTTLDWEEWYQSHIAPPSDHHNES
jgi:putative DNA-invertase from lambdoid prophage Rac